MWAGTHIQTQNSFVSFSPYKHSLKAILDNILCICTLTETHYLRSGLELSTFMPSCQCSKLFRLWSISNSRFSDWECSSICPCSDGCQKQCIANQMKSVRRKVTQTMFLLFWKKIRHIFWDMIFNLHPFLPLPNSTENWLK